MNEETTSPEPDAQVAQNAPLTDRLAEMLSAPALEPHLTPEDKQALADAIFHIDDTARATAERNGALVGLHDRLAAVQRDAAAFSEIQDIVFSDLITGEPEGRDWQGIKTLLRILGHQVHMQVRVASQDLAKEG